MSNEPHQSPVWDDVMRVWTDPKGAAASGLRDGRGWADWWRVLVLYGLAFTFSYVMDGRTGADKLWGPLLGDDSASSEDGYPEYVYIALIVWFFVGTFLFQWLALPYVSGWFGGSRYRKDASTAYYFGFCAAFLSNFAMPVAGLLSVAMQAYYPPAGSYLMVCMLALSCLVVLYQSARVAYWAMFFGSYFSSLLTLTVSLVIGIFAGFLMLSMVAIPLYTFFPHSPDILP